MSLVAPMGWCNRIRRGSRRAGTQNATRRIRMASETVIARYADKFFGFGTWNAKIWFIGPGELCGKDAVEMERRLAVWNKRGQLALEDLRAFQIACGKRRWHGNRASPQPTWAQLIRV